MAFILEDDRVGRYVYYGNVTIDGSRILLYGAEPGVETRRALMDTRGRGVRTMTLMLRGLLGLPGERLLPFSVAGRTCVRLTNWHEEGSPYRRNFVEACVGLRGELEGVELPGWFQEALVTELPGDFG